MPWRQDARDTSRAFLSGRAEPAASPSSTRPYLFATGWPVLLLAVFAPPAVRAYVRRDR